MKMTPHAVAWLPLALSPGLWAGTASLTPTDVSSINVAGDAGAPVITTSAIGETLYIRMRDFASAAVRNNVGYLRFDLSSIPADATIQSAQLTLNKTAGDTVNGGRFALVGVLNQPGNIDPNWSSSAFAYGAEYSPAIFQDFLATSGSLPFNLANVADFSAAEAIAGNTITLTGDDLVAFLQECVDEGAVTFMVTMPGQGGSNDKSFTLAAATYSADPSLRPTLQVVFSDAGQVAPPTGLALSNVQYSATPSLTVGWDPTEGAISYDVYRRAAADETPTLVATVNSPSYFDSAVDLFGVYFYSVVVTTADSTSEATTELRVEVKESGGAPAAPQGLWYDDLAPNSITLTWDAVPGAFYYDVYRADREDGAYTAHARVVSPTLVDTDDVQGFRPYAYKVKATTSTGVSGYSDSVLVDARFSGGAKPTQPQNLQITGGTTFSIDLAWDAVAGAEGYYVSRSTRPDADFHTVAITDATTLSDTFAVMPQNDYYYRVAAVNNGGISPVATIGAAATLNNIRQMEYLTRAPVAVKSGMGVLVSWRLLGSDPEDISFNIYRDGKRLNSRPLTGATNYFDLSGSTNATYEVRARIGNYEVSRGEVARSMPNGYLSVPIQEPPMGTLPDNNTYTYTANDASVADLDGDGEYEIVLKWEPTASGDNDAGYRGIVYLDAYELDGTRLWRINLGHNIRAGAHYTQFVVYDLDGDGKAEVVCKTADGTIDGQGTVIGDINADYRDVNGYVLAGPEYYTAFRGTDGAIIDTIDYVPQRGDLNDWGDTYGNRVDRFNAGVAYFDGVHPSVYACRGYYGGQAGKGPGRTVIAAFDLVDNQLVQRWVFDTQVDGSQYIGQGNHNTTIGDVDGDGKDEFMHGSLTLDDDGSVLWCSFLGHGDAMHYGDLDPHHPGMEIYSVKESTGVAYHHDYRSATTGELIWGVFTGSDTGRGVAADIDPRYAGSEAWGGANINMWNAWGDVIGPRSTSMNFTVYWDGDPLSELTDNTRIYKWDYLNAQLTEALSTTGTDSNNGTKSTPNLQADILGDWREEVIWRSSDNTELRIYSTPHHTWLRIPTLMHDSTYRVAVAWQNSAYNQPPHPGFFIGHNMPAVAMPKIYVKPVPELAGLTAANGNYTTAVRVMLTANLRAPLTNEYRLDGGSWTPYAAPFLVDGNGNRVLEFRTKDGEGNVIASSETSFTIAKKIPGDLDNDNDVDLADRALLMASLRKCAGQPGFNAAADLNNSGCVDNADYAVWLGYYNAYRTR